jgi:branched-chain amino acid transport system ATP-binding protein
MANPDMILLDEPSESLAPLVVAGLVQVLGEIKQKGMTILMADQNLKLCRRVCERGYIIEKERIVHEDTMEAILENESVIKKYLAM